MRCALVRPSVDQCFDSPTGTTRVSPDVMECNPILCEDNERVLANACTACEGGSYNLAGDDTRRSDTSCDEPCAPIIGERCGAAEDIFFKVSNTGVGDRFGVVE